jgi:hypothetical protein
VATRAVAVGRLGGADRWRRDAIIVVVGASLVAGAAALLDMATTSDYLPTVVGTDVRWYLEATDRWLAGHSWYMPFQTSGPYDLTTGVLYPPTALALFVPFTILPLPLWWAIPLLIIGWCVRSDRPTAAGFALIAACLAFPMSIVHLINGNPVIWVAALVALGLRVRGPAIIVLLLKPSLLPLAVIGVGHAGWWLTGAAVLSACVFLAPAWLDYVSALQNATGPSASLLYSVKDLPLIAIPLIARMSSTVRPPVSWRGHRLFGKASSIPART